MAIWDSLEQGFGDVYGTYNKVYPATPKIVGGTVVNRPRSYNLSNLYAPEASGVMPTAPVAPIADPGDIYGEIRGDQPLVPTTGMPSNIEDMLEASPDWVKQNINATWQWFPANAQEGEIYQGNDQKYYIFRGGKWTDEGISGIKGVPTTGMAGQYAHYKTLPMDHAKLYLPIEKAQQMSYDEWVQWYYDYLGDPSNKFQIDNATQRANVIRALEEEMRLLGIDPETRGEVSTVDGYMDQWNTLMTNLESGEWTLEDIPEGNLFYDWFQGVVDESWNTGLITGQGFTGEQVLDENGNPVLDENGQPLYELSDSMKALVDNLDDQTSEEFNEYMRQVNRYAAERGHTTASGFYSGTVSQHIADQTMQIEETIRARMGAEIEQQYTYIANSLGNMVTSMVDAETGRMIQERMFQEYENIWAQYEVGLSAMAHEAAMTEAARTGQIITAIIAFISKAMGVGLYFPIGG